MATKTISGARCRFKLDGNAVGFAGGVSGGESIDYEPVETLDYLHAREHVPVAYRVSLTARIFRIVGASLKALGIFPTLGANGRNVLTSGDLVASVEDNVTGNTIALWEGVKCAETNFDIEPRGITQYQTSFVAIKLYDEFERPIGA